MKRKSLLNLSGVDWEDHTGKYPLLYCANIYYGCQHDCQYCYSKKIYHWKRPWRDAEPVENAVELAEKEIKRREPGRIMFCSMNDPYQSIERETRLARGVLEVLLDSEFHVLIMTKSDLVARDYGLIKSHENVEVGFTITALDSLPDWEPGAPGNRRRIEALKHAKENLIKTYVSMEPWIPEVTDPIEIMGALGPWVDRWIVGTLNYQGIDFSYYKRKMPLLLEYVADHGLNAMWKKELRPFLP